MPLTASQSPLTTTKLVDDVFCDFTPAGTGLVFASGLTPFVIVCEGHAKAFENMRLMKKAKISEGGTSMSLQDAERVTSADVKFPSTAHFAGEKLCGWSVVINVFHGVAHDVANRVRNFVIAVVPHLHLVQCNLAESPGVGMAWCVVSCMKHTRNASAGPMRWQMGSWAQSRLTSARSWARCRHIVSAPFALYLAFGAQWLTWVSRSKPLVALG